MTWEMKRLGDVVSVVRRINSGRAMPYVGMEHISSGTGEFLGEHTPTVVKSNTFMFEPGHLLYGRLRPYLNKVLLPDFSGHCSTEVFPMKPSGEVDTRFLFYWITSEPIVDRINATCTGARMPRANVDEVLEFEIPLPPLPEQQRIVTKLDAAFAALAEAQAHVERNRANARELFESYLNGVFEGGELDAELMRLGDVCKTGSGATPLRSRKDYYDGGNVPWLLSGEVAQGEVTKATNFITELALKETSVKMFPPGTVLVAMYGATAGEVGILRFASTTNQAVCGIHPNDHFIPEYLYFVFLQKKAELVAQAVGGAQPNISQEKIKNTVIPLPTIEQQRVAVNRLEAVRHKARQLESTYQQKLLELEGLKKGLLAAAFRGEL